jgi:hypothetical protein
MAAEEDVPLGDAARHYEQKFGARVRQVRKGGARPPAGGGSGTGRTAIGLAVVVIVVVRLALYVGNSGRHSSPAPTFTPPPQVNFEQQRKAFEELERVQREMERRRAWRPVAPPLPDRGAEPSYRFEEGDVPLPEGLCYRIVREARGDAPTPGKRLTLFLDDEARALVERAARGERLGAVEEGELRAALNEVLERRELYDERFFRDRDLPPEAQAVAARRERADATELRKLNRLALEAAYPRQIVAVSARGLRPAGRETWTEVARKDLEEARQEDAARR